MSSVTSAWLAKRSLEVMAAMRRSPSAGNERDDADDYQGDEPAMPSPVQGRHDGSHRSVWS